MVLGIAAEAFGISEAGTSGGVSMWGRKGRVLASATAMMQHGREVWGDPRTHARYDDFWTFGTIKAGTTCIALGVAYMPDGEEGTLERVARLARLGADLR